MAEARALQMREIKPHSMHHAESLAHRLGLGEGERNKPLQLREKLLRLLADRQRKRRVYPRLLVTRWIDVRHSAAQCVVCRAFFHRCRLRAP